MFAKYNKDGKVIRYNKAVIDWTGKKKLTEDSHLPEANINQIIKRHGADLIHKVAMLKQPEMRFDDVTGNDFQEAMDIITKAQSTFDDMPSALRKQFENSPAKFLDFVQNPDNKERMYEMGLAIKPQEPPTVKVEVTNESLVTKAVEDPRGVK